MASAAIVRQGIDLPYEDRIRFGFTGNHEREVEEIRLGGGYEYAYLNSSSPNGHVRETYDLTWYPLTKAEATFVIGNVPFYVLYWVPEFALGNEYWICKSIAYTQVGRSDTYQVTASIMSYKTNVELVSIPAP